MKIIPIGFLCIVLILVPSILSAQQTNTGDTSPANPSKILDISAAGMGGAFNTDLEKRFYNDKLGGGFMSGGIGYNFPWANKGLGGIDLSARLKMNKLLLYFDYMRFESSPFYQGFVTANAPGISLYSLEDVKFTPLLRTSTTGSAGWLFTKPENTFQVAGFIGLRRTEIDAVYGITRVSGGSIGGIGYSAVEVGHDSTSTGRATGFVFGLDLRYRAKENLELRGVFAIQNLSGTWRQELQTYLFSSRVDATYRNENGLYSISGTQLDLGIYYTVRPTWTLFFRAHFMTSTIKDSKVESIALSSAGTTATNVLLNYLLTYPGSAAPDKIQAFIFGVEKQIAF